MAHNDAGVAHLLRFTQRLFEAGVDPSVGSGLRQFQRVAVWVPVLVPVWPAVLVPVLETGRETGRVLGGNVHVAASFRPA